MADILRHLVSQKKTRYEEGGYDLDLTCTSSLHHGMFVVERVSGVSDAGCCRAMVMRHLICV